MPVRVRLREVPGAFEAPLRGAIETALDGDWCVTLSQSHLDGQWHLQLDGPVRRCRVVLPALGDVSVTRLQELLRQLASVDEPPAADATLQSGDRS